MMMVRKLAIKSLMIARNLNKVVYWAGYWYRQLFVIHYRLLEYRLNSISVHHYYIYKSLAKTKLEWPKHGPIASASGRPYSWKYLVNCWWKSTVSANRTNSWNNLVNCWWESIVSAHRTNSL